MGEMFLDDGDIRLYQGDVLSVLAGMPDESVDCVVTSPPYWGLRDYGTGAWDGGDPDCDHLGAPHRTQAGFNERYFGKESGTDKQGDLRELFRDECGKCGARRVDQQLGLEPTPDLFVANMVAVFREVRRVLAAHGTCWVNLGDSYAAQTNGGPAQSDATTMTGGRKDFDLPARNRGGLKQKDLVGIPWRVAFALQADGWYLRADIIWAKPNPMPESVTDRPTKSHEYVFLLTKQPRYFFDQEAVREAHSPDGRKDTTVVGGNGSIQHRDGERWPNSGRNVRSVWQIATQPYPEAHFATYPEELVRRCVLAGCPVRVCRVCGKPSERIVERGESDYARMKAKGIDWRDMREHAVADGKGHDSNRAHIGGTRNEYGNAFSYTAAERTELGWSDCGHNDWRPGVTLDPFIGSGTTCKVARDFGRHSIGIDLSADYLALAARRLQQLSLLT